MNAQIRPIAELNRRATEALIKEVGPVDAVRFLNQFRTGSGNYTEERKQLFQGMTAKQIIADIKARRQIPPPPK